MSTRSLASLALVLLFSARAFANDSIFPPQPAAAANINWQKGFFVVNGKPTIISSGEIHYARVPRALWRDRLVRAKRAGLNTIQTYVFWNAHEGHEGTFDFTDALDLDAWLSLIEELGLYAIVRPGPYNCAEWESGGLPSWLTVKPGMAIRTDDATYMQYTDKYYEKIIPILVKHQIHKGGSLLMVQLENEHPLGWGTDATPFLQHLYDKARSLGLDVPLFYSGLNHGHDPAGETPFMARDMPWYTSEFWVGWFDGGGEPTPDEILKAGRGTWKVFAFGGAGYSYYVVHGGTNFGYSSDDVLPTSYDYRAPIGEAGQLRKSYPQVRRATLFGQMFGALLATASDGSADVGATVAPGLRALVRKSAAGTIVFVDNPGTAAASTGLTLTNPALTLPGQGQLSLDAGEIRPVVLGARWTPNLTFAYTTARILGSAKYGSARYLVVYGSAGETGDVALAFDKAPATLPSSWSWDAAKKQASLTVTFPMGDALADTTIDSGDGETIHVLGMNRALADRSWITEQALFVGPSYVADDLSLRFPLTGGQATIFDAQGQHQVSAPMATQPTPPPLTWRARDGAAEGAATFDDSTWLSSPQPQPLSANDGFANGYGWYRTTFDAPDANGATLFYSAEMDDVQAFVNGQLVTPGNGQLVFPTKQGQNTIAILATQEGRQKLVGFYGTVGQLGYKGLWGPIAFGQPLSTLASWRMSINGQPSTNTTYAAPSYDDSSWTVVAPGPDTMGGLVTYAWFRAHVNVASAPAHGYLFLHGIDDNAWVFVNGTQVGYHAGWSTPALIDAGSALVAGDNVIAICIQNTAGPGGLSGAVDVIAGRSGGAWRFRGGVGALDETPVLGNVKNWDAFLAGTWQDAAPAAGRPTFWRADVQSPLPAIGVATVGLRMQGVSAGSVWINGHNLGFYHNGTLLYVPEVWLGAMNTIVVFDRGGMKPTSVAFEYIEVNTSVGGPGGGNDGGVSSDGGVDILPDGGVSSDGGSGGGGGSGGSGGHGGKGGSGGGKGGCGCWMQGGDAPSGGLPATAALLFVIVLMWRVRRRS